MQRIIPNLWFDDEVEEATDFYTRTFSNASIGHTDYWTETAAENVGQPAGSVMSREFVLEGCAFYALNGSPGFDFSPATSFIFNCPETDEIDRLWDALTEGGSKLMPLDSYEFSDRYGWCQDRFGVSWQLMHSPGDEPHIVPCLMYVDERYGQAEEAIELYTSTFDESSVGSIQRHGPDEEPHREGTVKFADFTVYDECFAAMETRGGHDFDFTQAVSFIVQCDDQTEIDRYWEALSADGGQELQFGRVMDPFGVTWQIIPHQIRTLMHRADDAATNRISEALLGMQKIDLHALKAAAE
jgi:predicted 3-demethylubiquinone-9 3-methyltransferase (glyoxalase superfamily)